MFEKKRFAKTPDYIIGAQAADELTADLYLTGLAELELAKTGTAEPAFSATDYQLFYCIQGEVRVRLESDWVNMKAEQFCVVPPGRRLAMEAGANETVNLLAASFNGTKARLMEPEFSVVRDLVPSVNNRVANRKMLFDELFAHLARGFNDANRRYTSFCFSHLLATFVYGSRTGDDIWGEENPMVQNLIRYMEQNIGNKLSLADLANESGYSVTYLSTVFSRVTNYSPLSYFSHLKISKSCEYLDQTKLKVKQIAFLLGYTDAYYFSKDFQKKMGISPRAYRQRLKH